MNRIASTGRSPSEDPTGQDGPGYRRVAARLRREILDGTAPPGTWLRLQAVADRCEVSVQPVREALQVLEGEGMIEIFPNRGARVRGIDRERIIHIYEIREAMESFLARRFAEEASLSDLRRLEAIQARHDEAMAARDVELAARINLAFHHYVNSRSGNVDALSVCERYQELGHALLQRLGPAPDHFERITREHHALLDAFRRRDPDDAQRLNAAHIRATVAAHLRLFDAAFGSDASSTWHARDTLDGRASA